MTRRRPKLALVAPEVAPIPVAEQGWPTDAIATRLAALRGPATKLRPEPTVGRRTVDRRAAWMMVAFRHIAEVSPEPRDQHLHAAPVAGLRDLFWVAVAVLIFLVVRHG